MKSKKLQIFIVIMTILLTIILIIYLANKFMGNKLYCEDGYTLINEQCSKTIVVSPITNTYCPDGFELNNNSCIKKETQSPIINYFCVDTTYREADGSVIASASTLSGSTCSYKSSHIPIQKKTCPLNLYPANDTTCKGYIDVNAYYRASNQKYYCPDDYDYALIGTKCRLYLEKPYIITTECVEGYTLTNGMCEKIKTYSAPYNTTCPNGFDLINNTCIKNTTTNTLHKYICPEGYELENNICQHIIIKDAIKK